MWDSVGLGERLRGEGWSWGGKEEPEGSGKSLCAASCVCGWGFKGRKGLYPDGEGFPWFM